MAVLLGAVKGNKKRIGLNAEEKISRFRNKLVKINIGKNEPSIDFAIKIIDMLLDGELVVK
jgi:sRNA-binding carbon storage regulator CsrA